MADEFFDQKTILIDQEAPDSWPLVDLTLQGPFETHFPTHSYKLLQENESVEPDNSLNYQDSEEKSVQQIRQQMGDRNSNHAFIKFQDELVKLEHQTQQMVLRRRQKLDRLEERAKMMSRMSKISSKRDNNTILKPIFTKFKKLIRNHKPFDTFFDFRTYQENRVSLVDFEKLFSYAQIKGCFPELKQLLSQQYEALTSPKVDYTASRIASYLNYIDRIYSALTFFDDHHQRMDMLYNYRKHASQLKQIEVFRECIIKQQQNQGPI